MPNPTVVGFSGNFTRPSKTRGFVDQVVRDIARQHGLSASTYDIEDLGPSLGTAKWARDLDGQARAILDSDRQCRCPGGGVADLQGQLHRPVQALLRPVRSRIACAASRWC